MEVENDRLTLFSLSCRALGRDVEQAMIDFISNNHQLKSFELLSINKNDELKKILTDVFGGNTP